MIHSASVGAAGSLGTGTYRSWVTTRRTVWAPAVTTLLYLIIFTVALGREGKMVLGVPFADFIAPGLIVMATIGVLDRQADAAEARDGRKLAELTAARVDLTHQLQLERRWTAAAVGSAGAFGTPELTAQRQATDASIAGFRDAADDARGVTGELATQIDLVQADLEQLPTVRTSVAQEFSRIGPN